MDFYEKTEKESIIYQGKIIKVKELDIKLPNGLMDKREIVEHPGAVAILTTTKDGKIVLIKQFRKACEEILWEIPAGKLEKGEAPLDCAKRELKEETGYTARNWALLGKFYTSPGFCNELIYIYLASNLIAGEAILDEDENLEQYLLDSSQIDNLIENGHIKDMKTITALLFFKQLQSKDKGD